MPGQVILSHGSDSGPDATKVSALARVAESMGWSSQRPDYRGDDAAGYADSVSRRVTRLLAAMRGTPRPQVLVGSSMGAFVSGLASCEVPCDGLFLVALPIGIPGCPRHFDMARDVPTMLVHGWRDELCPAADAVFFAGGRKMPTVLLDDGHRLSTQVAAIEYQFRGWLGALAG